MTAASDAAIPTSAALAALMRLTLLRIARGRSLWIAAVIAAMPVVFGAFARGHRLSGHYTFLIEVLVLSVLAPMLVASAIGEDFEHGTTSYLWSRPLARWTVLIGKLGALAPIVVAYAVISWVAAIGLVSGGPPSARQTLAIAGVALAFAMLVAGIATLVPRHAMALAIAYLGVDFVLGQIPAPMQILSATHQAALLVDSRNAALEPAITLAALAIVWLAIGLRRIRRLEV